MEDVSRVESTDSERTPDPWLFGLGVWVLRLYCVGWLLFALVIYFACLLGFGLFSDDPLWEVSLLALAIALLVAAPGLVAFLLLRLARRRPVLAGTGLLASAALCGVYVAGVPLTELLLVVLPLAFAGALLLAAAGSGSSTARRSAPPAST